jgi:hypothetical protein
MTCAPSQGLEIAQNFNDGCEFILCWSIKAYKKLFEEMIEPFITHFNNLTHMICGLLLD